eukprot:1016183-Amphidinium_carterae.2
MLPGRSACATRSGNRRTRSMHKHTCYLSAAAWQACGCCCCSTLVSRCTSRRAASAASSGHNCAKQGACG